MDALGGKDENGTGRYVSKIDGWVGVGREGGEGSETGEGTGPWKSISRVVGQSVGQRRNDLTLGRYLVAAWVEDFHDDGLRCIVTFTCP